MSEQAVKEFLDKGANDAEFSRHIDRIVEGLGAEEAVAAERIVELGTQKGYEFTTEELRQELISRGAEPADLELSAGDLDQVSGGLSALNSMKYDKWESLGSRTIIFNPIGR